MLGLMMDRPLLISQLIEHAAEYHGDNEIVSRSVEGPIHRYTYADAARRSRQLANALKALDVVPGDRVGTLAWNGYRHFEIYFAVSGSGAVCHTLNPRLFPEQIAYIVNHADDRFIFADLNVLAILEGLKDNLAGVQGVIVMTDRAHMPGESSLPNLLCYEDLIAAQGDVFDWPDLDENTAASLCYTSGTTGNPKGVLYSHRSTILHAYAINGANAMGFTADDAILPVVPMFHANAWGIPYAAPMVGAKLVFPGFKMDGASLYELFDSEDVTIAAGVPTVWLELLRYCEANGERLEKLQRTLIGGSAPPRAMVERFDKEHGVRVLQGWGMTEMSPLGTITSMRRGEKDLPAEQQYDLIAKQGRPIFGVDLKIVDDGGRELSKDGVAFGNLLVRGPWIAKSYFRGEGPSAFTSDGWFHTGDVCTLNPHGYMTITDRSKDVIKSGGEWISSIDLENVAMGHPAVEEAAVIGVAHPEWNERPLLVVVRKRDSTVTREELLKFFDGKVVKWWIPDDVVFIDSLPHTATGKLLKTKVREDFRGHRLPSAAR
ncbi:3-(methylthio)propionyl-CoA ligase [Brevundimonas mediterranea]|uniref:3-methylmercaptopropionyl-CoA ligase n=1 Tax=Brevundimonas mediterranea TaxID=74329 RepID=A0A7W6EZB4_9CAUL|nr:3-(methylthio)propionyl-CoA ligase [Brevundimonas mediterranea]MBB3871242.1 fatty-acyl-CoA synthase [Brevundimonas mediterranea]